MSDKVKELEKENLILKERLAKLEKSKPSKKKRWQFFVKFTTTFIAGKKLKTSIYNSIQEFNEQKRISLQTTSDLIASIIRRLTRIGVVALLFALLPTTLMIYQNSLLKKQNRKIQEQTHLAEASRRSAQMFIMGDILSDINTELETKKNKKLSKTLVSRIVGLSRAMKPYRYLVDDALIAKSISPERGQLLITLCKSDLNPAFFEDQILQESDFTQAELKGANLYNVILRGINLKDADLSDAILVNIDAKRAIFENANLKNADLGYANLSNAVLKNSNLSSAILLKTKLNKVNFTNAVLDSAVVDSLNWLTYIKDDLKLKGAETLYEKYKVDSVYSKVFDKKVATVLSR
ncbi:pentapeptide repeat-containing protein [Polaribacter vadi]|uniref:pentapeptide repeat-containing protein n=1 Tax=Polaribacter TaxID=52959 RepID=UPI001C0801B5|nr:MULTISPECIES: pentapeptide repeat-containing protein [Polaribacter]MBU3009980.1 pentapeptide repeat-containing protein [Polaribacter vadi]MDO6739786.1 pentapeptide repeat-containing protein [Polaribacter sp. 1_MG-2023]